MNSAEIIGHKPELKLDERGSKAVQDYKGNPNSRNLYTLTASLIMLAHPHNKVFEQKYFENELIKDAAITHIPGGVLQWDENNIKFNPLIPLSQMPEVKKLVIDQLSGRDEKFNQYVNSRRDHENRYPLYKVAAFSDDPEVHAALIRDLLQPDLAVNRISSVDLTDRYAVVKYLISALTDYDGTTINPYAKDSLIRVFDAFTKELDAAHVSPDKYDQVNVQDLEELRKHIVAVFISPSINYRVVTVGELVAHSQWYEAGLEKEQELSPVKYDIARSRYSNDPELYARAQRYFTESRDKEQKKSYARQLTQAVANSTDEDLKSRVKVLTDQFNDDHPNRSNL